MQNGRVVLLPELQPPSRAYRVADLDVPTAIGAQFQIVSGGISAAISVSARARYMASSNS